MNTTVTPRPLRRAAPVRAFTLGAYGLVFLGAGHLALSAASSLATRTERQRELDAAMRESTFALLGLQRTVLDVFNGLSVAMAFFSVTCGLLILAAVRHSPTLVQRRTAFGWIALTSSLAALVVSVLLLPPPPIIVLTITSCAFAVSLRGAAPAAPGNRTVRS
ncbi:hypothetical protein ACFWCB_19660 [Streptomyces sp. NPDC060048]|uniref:LIC_13387 family protein n=1 Tax=unclassified Streptomyces TaxID=2593676 RepID=UPI00368E2406